MTASVRHKEEEMPFDRLSWLSCRYKAPFIALMLFVVGAAIVASDPSLNARLEEAIGKVRTRKSLDARVDAAEDLLRQMTGINPQAIDDKTAADLVSLLDDPDYDVRSLMTVAIGQMGRKAKAGDPVLNKKIEQAIARVRAEKSLNARYHAAEDLSTLLNGINPMLVDDKTVADMVRLLDDPEDAVLGWVAGSLGVFGPRAKAAVPKLLALLPAADCERARAFSGVTAADAIRPALERMGVKPPPYNPQNCK